jgi:hypothetical protein
MRGLAERLGFAIELSPTGIATAPLLEPGKPLTPEEFELLPDSKKAEVRTNGQELARHADEVLLSVRHVERGAHAQLQALDREAVRFAVGHLLDALRTKYADTQAVLDHLNCIQADLVAHLDDFRASEADSSQGPAQVAAGRQVQSHAHRSRPWARHETGAQVGVCGPEASGSNWATDCPTSIGCTGHGRPLRSSPYRSGQVPVATRSGSAV